MLTVCTATNHSFVLLISRGCISCRGSCMLPEVNSMISLRQATDARNSCNCKLLTASDKSVPKLVFRILMCIIANFADCRASKSMD